MDAKEANGVANDILFENKEYNVYKLDFGKDGEEAKRENKKDEALTDKMKDRISLQNLTFLTGFLTNDDKHLQIEYSSKLNKTTKKLTYFDKKAEMNSFVETSEKLFKNAFLYYDEKRESAYSLTLVEIDKLTLISTHFSIQKFLNPKYTPNAENPPLTYSTDLVDFFG